MLLLSQPPTCAANDNCQAGGCTCPTASPDCLPTGRCVVSTAGCLKHLLLHVLPLCLAGVPAIS